jgi:hypothetical protein
MTNRFHRPGDHPGDLIQHPLNGFDKAAYDAFYNGLGESKRAIIACERRDGVAWTEWGRDGVNIGIGVLAQLRPDVARKVFRIRINGLMSVRITGDPISFLANKTDHYIPAECPVEFIPIPLREDQ